MGQHYACNNHFVGQSLVGHPVMCAMQPWDANENGTLESDCDSPKPRLCTRTLDETLARKSLRQNKYTTCIPKYKQSTKLHTTKYYKVQQRTTK